MEVNASALAAMKTPMASLLLLFIPKLRYYPGVGTAKCVLGSVCPAGHSDTRAYHRPRGSSSSSSQGSRSHKAGGLDCGTKYLRGGTDGLATMVSFLASLRSGGLMWLLLSPRPWLAR